MQKHIILAIAASAAATSSLAAPIADPMWVQTATPEQIGATYPMTAARQGIEQSVTLSCGVDFHGLLYDCHALTGDTLGFNDAAVRASKFYRLSEAQFAAAAGLPTVLLKVSYRLSDLGAYQQNPQQHQKAVGGAPQTSSAQFDLICTGRFDLANGKSSPANLHLVLDLNRGIYCEAGTCTPRRVVALETEFRFFPEQSEPGVELTMSVNRSTGILSFSGRSISGNTAGLALGAITANCDKAPFSGIAANKF